MLEPENRHLLLDALRPPAGHQLDLAVGTTYSLDLLTLLMAPLAFAQFDAEVVDDQPAPDPIMWLEAMRRHAERIVLFCQAGAIAVPSEHRGLYAFLERSVHEVSAPDPAFVFHPKLWALRYRNSLDATFSYRLICATRNLTFDRSWDTILQLDGAPPEDGDLRHADVEAASGPLRDFVLALPGLAAPPLAPKVRALVAGLAEELATVRFDPPEGFDELAFRPLGLGTGRRWPLPREADRLLVISPFLSPGFLARLPQARHGATLVSRAESLDRVGAAALRGFETLVLSPQARDPSEERAAGGEAPLADDGQAAEDPASRLTGLHAKLFVADAGGDAHVWTGSANATTAGFGGNVEFLVELHGRRTSCGVAAFLDPRDEVASLRDLLEPYTPPADEPQAETPEDALRQRLERARRAIARLDLQAEARREGDDTYRLDLISSDAVERDVLDGTTVRCRPITLKPERAVAAFGPAGAVEATFGPISLLSLTPFIAFEVQAGTGEEVLRFVRNADLHGLPSDRDDRLLMSLLTSRGAVLRYLLLLLADGPDGGGPLPAGLLGSGSDGQSDAGQSSPAIPLLEPLLQVLSRDPERLDPIGRLIEDLRRTPDGSALLPDGLDAIWDPIWTVRQEARR